MLDEEDVAFILCVISPAVLLLLDPQGYLDLPVRVKCISMTQFHSYYIYKF